MVVRDSFKRREDGPAACDIGRDVHGEVALGDRGDYPGDFFIEIGVDCGQLARDAGFVAPLGQVFDAGGEEGGCDELEDEIDVEGDGAEGDGIGQA